MQKNLTAAVSFCEKTAVSVNKENAPAVQAGRARIEWIDMAKFIAIFAMVWGHSGVSYNVDCFIHAFHMPVFFFLSGAVFRPEKYRSVGCLILKRLKSLVLPYFIYGTALFVLWKFLLSRVIKTSEFSFSDLFNALFTNNAQLSPYACIQWFLTCLFFAEIIFYIMARLSRGRMWILSLMTVFVSVLGYILPRLLSFRLWWGLDIAFAAAAFYAAGYLFSRLSQSRFVKETVKPNYILMILFLAAGLLCTYFNGYVNMRVMQYGNYFLFYAAAVFLTLFFISLSAAITSWRPLKKTLFIRGALFLGQNTLLILLLNQLFIKLSEPLKQKIITASGADDLLVNFAFAVMVMLIMLPVAWAVNKFLPFTLGRGFKKKPNHSQGSLK